MNRYDQYQMQIARQRLIALMMLGCMALALPDYGLAQSFGTNSQILNDSCRMLVLIKDWLFGVVYILGAIGLVLIAITAFLGRFKFSHLIALGGGLFIVAAADMLIGFITGGNSQNCIA
ncbi:MAG: TrbC/VirB2 family protein [Roseovarius sp.]|nr:TrbC/VirB2 family protein [Roseovarius sp.]